MSAEATRFLICALPRSRTAWLSAFICAHGYVCIHEPFLLNPGLENLDDLWGQGIDGICDPSIYVTHQKQLVQHFLDRPTAVILRGRSDARAAFEKWLGYPLPNWERFLTCLDAFRRVFSPMTIDYDQLDDFGAVNELLTHLTGHCADRTLFRMFSLLRIEQHQPKALEMIASHKTSELATGGQI